MARPRSRGAADARARLQLWRDCCYFGALGLVAVALALLLDAALMRRWHTAFIAAQCLPAAAALWAAGRRFAQVLGSGS